MLPILFYDQIDSTSVQKNFKKVLKNLSEGDFKSADVRKMTNTRYYRARLNIKDRLLFTFAVYNQKTYLLLLEVILNHDYSKSRFLKGAELPDENELQPLRHIEEVHESEVEQLNYLNNGGQSIHLLNKFISFDNTQQAIFSLHPPLIIIGSAGSGKTVLVLEKLKQLKGNIAYISLNNYLVENARRTYFSNGYENEDSDVDFLSFKQYLESWEIPEGKEINFRLFEQWFNKHAQQLKINEPYRIFEEFKGVLTGSPLNTAYLSKEEYLSLGIKQSIFTQDKREMIYDLFAKYLLWLKEYNYYDSNILSFEYLTLVKPKYDYIMIDEVQDITGIQLKCIMQSLLNKSHFILTGDSNQIVHPNFFSWSKIKSYLYHHGTDNKQVHILQTNYRNSHKVVELSNKLLKIKNLRFGSIDKESNYLINTVSNQEGEVLLMQDNDKVKADLNRKTKDSIRYAVIVADNTLKNEARKYFKTPLIFSVQEAKGLEYENVILLNFISANRAEFNEIIRGVDIDDLQSEELQYARPSDKNNKDAEIYKFYINSFYVAITRSVKNIYLFESDVNHAALGLLSLKEIKKPLQVVEQKSGKEEWLKEAQRLDEQGKHEQAEQIRARHLGYDYISREQLAQIKILALDPDKKEQEVKKERKQLFQYAVTHHQVKWIDQLAELQFPRAVLYRKELRQNGKEFAKNCRLGRKEGVSSIISKYSANFTLLDTDQTGLMISLFHGQGAVAKLLLQQNADILIQDKDGLMAIDYLLQGYYKNVIFKQQTTATIETLNKFWHQVRPAFIMIETGRRRLSIGAQSMIFFLLICMRCIHDEMQNKVNVKFDAENHGSEGEITLGEFSMNDIMQFVECIPNSILPPYRRQRSYVNSILAGHEVDKTGALSKRLFKRTRRGCYILSPLLKFHIVEEEYG